MQLRSEQKVNLRIKIGRTQVILLFWTQRNAFSGYQQLVDPSQMATIINHVHTTSETKKYVFSSSSFLAPWGSRANKQCAAYCKGFFFSIF